MIRLGLKQEPQWLELLPGVSIRTRPFTTALFFAAQTAMLKSDAQTENEQGPELKDAMRGLAFIKGLARLAIMEWDGVVDQDGKTLSPTPETIDALMDIWQIAASFERLYARTVSEIGQEKNA